ncbi:YdeI/OmpD-associated family protein [Marinobacter zhejiangensis]|uniref:Bacteriocin-protection, YdeI or OmpD-Associated n=1 Tax=Marinobacter zhejiangensis TaxID=488535 RepID=A0A1I4NCQ7_9GAMM|nr:YdeI/OmpD-associated family protein [Marinobacter zhejiangensis]SFM13281.1 Bacteriocin-protection, YdeI or OmpD-Associated [Marinobacter zhejiangensis]
MKPSLVGKHFSFEADLESWAEGMDYCAVCVPAEITNALGTKGPVLVKASVNESKPFQVSLFPVGGGQHYIRIKASIRRLTEIKVGDHIRLSFVVLDPDDVKVPDDLMKVLTTEGMADAFMAIPPGQRNFIIRRIQEAAKPATREKRVYEAVSAALERRSNMKGQDGVG